ncbi:hypothetical protein H6P81_011738 [Aristolochia fimbriata]|uniref:Uncharacterized protein n=1 Tax=Aristolochia fimbriata TaxID=158543 RepID=A0AAV7E9U2_ARIFI|nr:hypothetical protein H6P81_011738 [Aristolochia fimbriata]
MRSRARERVVEIVPDIITVPQRWNDLYSSLDCSIKVWKLRKANLCVNIRPLLRGPQSTLNRPSTAFKPCLFSPDRHWIASASFDKSMKLWNGTTGMFMVFLTRENIN